MLRLSSQAPQSPAATDTERVFRQLERLASKLLQAPIAAQAPPPLSHSALLSGVYFPSFSQVHAVEAVCSTSTPGTRWVTRVSMQPGLSESTLHGAAYGQLRAQRDGQGGAWDPAWGAGDASTHPMTPSEGTWDSSGLLRFGRGVPAQLDAFGLVHVTTCTKESLLSPTDEFRRWEEGSVWREPIYPKHRALNNCTTPMRWAL